MPAEIKKIVGRRWTYPGERHTNQSYNVYYASGKRVQYGTHQNLPANLLRYILEADSAETTYYEGYTAGATYTVAKTVYIKTAPEETKPKAKRAQPIRVYSVLFYTQRNRVLANWEYLAAASNQKQAIEQARERWYAVRDEHLFNCRAKRIDKIPEDRELYTFKTLDTKWATWGYRR